MADDPSPDAPERDTTVAGLVLPALAGAVAVGFAATGAGLLLPGADLGDAATAGVRIGGLALAVAGLAALLTRWGRAARVPARDVAAVVVSGAVAVAGLTALTYAFSSASLDLGDGREQTVDTRPPPEPDTTISPSTLPDVDEGDEDDGLDLPFRDLAGLLPALLVFAVLCLAAYALARVLGLTSLSAWRRSATAVEPGEADPLDAATAEAGLEASLGAVSDGDAEPRDAISQAYALLLAALAEAGAGRRTQEAPHEHLRRVLTPLGVRPEPLHRLAELFVMARFSRHPVTVAHRDEASTALRQALDDLRAATAAREQPRPQEAR